MEDHPGEPTRVEVAEYVGALAQDLAKLARAQGFEHLAQLLELTRLEAQNIVEGWD